MDREFSFEIINKIEKLISEEVMNVYASTGVHMPLLEIIKLKEQKYNKEQNFI